MLAAAASGQERFVLRGQVVDADSGEPVMGAQVVAPLSERAVLTDSLGEFGIPFIEDRAYEIVVGAIGYNGARVTLGPDAEQGSTTIPLPADPQAMAALAVLEERLVQRRRLRRTRRLQLFEDAQLAASDDDSAYELVRRVANAQPCSGLEELCRLGRSRVRLCIDDARPNSGARELEQYDVSDLWLVEVYEYGREVRVYSRWYIDRITRTRQGELRLNPIC